MMTLEAKIPVPWIRYNPHLQVLQLHCRRCNTYSTYVFDTPNGERCQACAEERRRHAS